MISIKITWKYCLAFYCLIMLYASLHELVHHFAGAAICGAWGYKTFNYFSTACESNRWAYLATYAGPLFSFIMMWVGAYGLRKKNASPLSRQISFALIFAQLPFQRMFFPFFKMNDEFYASKSLFGDTQLMYWSVIIIIWLICLPPLVTAYRSITNKHRLAWFLFYLILFPVIIWVPVFLLLEYLLVNRHVLDQTFIGIAWLFLVNEIITVIGYFLTKKYFNTDMYKLKSKQLPT
ncbi:MAG: hypothetical protein IPG86_01920 [Chitinophagaceae bacterium]|nr:hypothetical protein [Chitinophagaceae bacterium]